MSLNPKIIPPVRSAHIRPYKVLTAVLFGFLTFFTGFLTVPLWYGPYPLRITWNTVLLMVITLAWGTKYGLIALLLGGAVLSPFFLTPQLGWVALVHSLALFTWVLLHGYGARRRWQGDAHPVLHNMYVLQLLYVLLRGVLFLILAPLLFHLEPFITLPDAITAFSMSYLLLFTLKGLFIEMPLLAVANTLLLLPILRRILLLSRKESSRYNARIILSSLFFGLLFSASALMAQHYLGTPAARMSWAIFSSDELNTTGALMALLFILAGGVIARYMERLIDTQDALLRSEETLRDALLDIRELNNHLQEKVDQRTSMLQEAVTELESFAQTVSSDLREPMEEIAARSVRMLSRHPEAEGSRIRGNLLSIRKIAMETTVLIEKLLEYSSTSKRALALSRIDLHALVTETVEKFRIGGDGKPIRLTYLQPLPKVWGDSMLLHQVVMNIVSNAVKFSTTREEIRIDVGCMDLTEEHLLYFRDHGIGFDMEHADKLFGVFKRLHRKEDYEGCGIGLATIRKIISRHGGEVWIEGAPDQGATVYFTLPKREPRGEYDPELPDTRKTTPPP